MGLTKILVHSKTLYYVVYLAFMLINMSYAQQPSFKCNSKGATCDALVDYVTPNTTTFGAVKALFGVKNLRTILGANGLPLSTLANATIPANDTVKIPFPCICTADGTGISNQRPVYTVAPGDGLDHIARDVFSQLVTYQEIQAVNHIKDANLIEVGQKLWIPLPCSCDEVDNQKVIHYGHVVPTGSTVQGIAQEYNTSEATLLRLNNMTSPNDLKAGIALDVPLRACSSMVDNKSLDYPLLVSNGTYVFTANNCVMCNCNAAANWILQCEPAGVNSSCAPIRCQGYDNFYLGNTTSSSCSRTSCAYAGYNSSTVLTTVATEATCPASGNKSSMINWQGWRWSALLVSIHIVLLCLPLL